MYLCQGLLIGFSPSPLPFVTSDSNDVHVLETPSFLTPTTSIKSPRSLLALSLSWCRTLCLYSRIGLSVVQEYLQLAKGLLDSFVPFAKVVFSLFRPDGKPFFSLQPSHLDLSVNPQTGKRSSFQTLVNADDHHCVPPSASKVLVTWSVNHSTPVTSYSTLRFDARVEARVQSHGRSKGLLHLLFVTQDRERLLNSTSVSVFSIVDTYRQYPKLRSSNLVPFVSYLYILLRLEDISISVNLHQFLRFFYC